MEMNTRGRVLLVEGAKAPMSSHLAVDFEHRVAAGEVEALQLVNHEAFDVVLVDLDIPKLDRHSLIRRLREERSVAAVVWVSAKRTNELVLDAAQEGVFHVLQKPTSPEVVAGLVDAGVQQSRLMVKTLRSLLDSKRSVPATDAKNDFAGVLEMAVNGESVVITKHDTPKAMLVSIERLGAVLAKQEPDLQALTREFDDLVARMQTPKARAAARRLLTATPQALGVAAQRAAARRRG